MNKNGRSWGEIMDVVAKNKFIFGSFFLFVFASSFLFLYLLNLVPNELNDEDITIYTPVVEVGKKAVATTTVKTAPVVTPTHITIDKIGVNTAISNPESTDIDVLNSHLLKGAIRYPGSGTPGIGNMFVMGHSTSLKIVNNQAYKAFNNLKNLEIGDYIKIEADGRTYLYQVANVVMVNSETTSVNLAVKRPMLTLVSCHTLGAKEDRWVVEAFYVGVESSP